MSETTDVEKDAQRLLRLIRIAKLGTGGRGAIFGMISDGYTHKSLAGICQCLGLKASGVHGELADRLIDYAEKEDDGPTRLRL